MHAGADLWWRSNCWYQLSNDEGVQYGIGIAVYEDRLKIEKADEEERKNLSFFFPDLCCNGGRRRCGVGRIAYQKCAAKS